MRSRRLGLRVAFWAALVAVLGAGGWLAHQLWVSNIIASGYAEDATNQLRAKWDAAPKSERAGSPVHIAPGETFALLRIPRLGDDYQWPISSGEQSLSWSLAWYPNSGQPGQVGNFALAGQRVGHGAAFARLLELQVEDKVIVETHDMIYTYRIVVAPASLTVDAHAGWVLDPVPGQPDELPWEPVITLTTAQDLLPTSDRSVAFGVLEVKKEK